MMLLGLDLDWFLGLVGKISVALQQSVDDLYQGLRLKSSHSYCCIDYLLQSLQVVRIAAPDHTGLLINQSAVVDQQNDLVTFSVTSPANRTSVVLFDIKHVRTR